MHAKSREALHDKQVHANDTRGTCVDRLSCGCPRIISPAPGGFVCADSTSKHLSSTKECMHDSACTVPKGVYGGVTCPHHPVFYQRLLITQQESIMFVRTHNAPLFMLPLLEPFTACLNLLIGLN